MSQALQVLPWELREGRWERRTPIGRLVMWVAQSARGSRWLWHSPLFAWGPPENFADAETAKARADKYLSAQRVTFLEPEGAPCQECRGKTIEFRGPGPMAEYRVCSRWREPGHLTEEQIRAELAFQREARRPQGRFA